jgi:hypothetical protein
VISVDAASAAAAAVFAPNSPMGSKATSGCEDSQLSGELKDPGNANF